MQTPSTEQVVPAGAVTWDLPRLNVPQRELVLGVLKRTAKRLICFEGAIRLGKSWGALILVWCLALLHPGIRILIARWKQEDVDGTLTEVWEAVSGLFPRSLHPKWDAGKHAYVFANGSIVYKKSLKAAEAETRDSKWRGMTLSVIVIDQFEECPRYVLEDIKGRMSQSKHAVTNQPYRYPLHLILLLNSIDEDHWLAEYFPTDNSIPGRLHLTGSVWDNRENLGEEVIEGLEDDYPVGDPRRRTLLEGKRGIVVDGEPCYSGYFDPQVNVRTDVRFNPYLPLLEGWDFSWSHPAVLWAQWDVYAGCLNILGGVQGYKMFLDTFVPRVLEIRYRWFPQCGIPDQAAEYLPHLEDAVQQRSVDVWSWCDPAGATNTSGSRVTGVTELNAFGIYPRSNGAANQAPERFAVIQAIAGMMRQAARDGGPRVRVNPRTVELRRLKGGKLAESPARLVVDAFSLGYVWDDKAPPDNNPNVKRPKKNHAGDKYSHLMNGLEYIVLGEQIYHRPTEKARERGKTRFQRLGGEKAAELRAIGQHETMDEAIARIAKLGRQFRDHDPADEQLGRGRYRVARSYSRGGWS